MTQQKTSELAFEVDRKESFKARLRTIIGQRSIRTAALDWGMSFSTLNNYLSRGTEPPFFVMSLIAHKENVSLEWLAHGIGEVYRDQIESNKTPGMRPVEPLEAAWGMIYKSLNSKEVAALISLLMKEGAKGVLALSAKNDDMDRLLTELPADEKERLIALHEAKLLGTRDFGQITRQIAAERAETPEQ
ncbi:hypothetical protein [Enterobacter mori]|uniref:hypothetical protein n=1 Tax=Enterobacter mori TaxID=539813 RepID=UPI003B8436A4